MQMNTLKNNDSLNNTNKSNTVSTLKKIYLTNEVNKILFDNFYLSFFGLVATSSVVYWGALRYESFQLMAINTGLLWYSVFNFILFTRLILYLTYRKTINYTNFAKQYYYLYILGSTLTALCWGMIILFLEPSPIYLQIFTMLIITGVVGGGVQTLSPSYLASFLYVLLGLGPIGIFIIRRMIEGHETYIYTSLMVTLVAYMIFLLTQGYRMNKLIIKSLLLTIQNLSEEILYTKAELEKIINVGIEGIWYVDENFNIIYANKRFLEMVGYNLDEVLGGSVLDFMDNDSRMQTLERVLTRYKTQSKEAEQFELKLFKKEGDPIWVHLVSLPEYDTKNQKIRFLGKIIEITELKQSMEEKLQSEEKYRAIVELSQSGIILLLDEKINFANKAMIHILNAETEADLKGKSIFDILDPKHHDLMKQRLAKINKTRKQNDFIEEDYVALNGEIKKLEVASSFFKLKNKPAILIIANDITKLIRAEKQITFLASHDPLTGLANRQLFEENIKISLPFSIQDPSYGIIVLFINLDRFKFINDTFGLKSGDLLIQEVAQRLKQFVQDSDILAKAEGDQYLILLRGYSKDLATLSKIAEKINQVVNEVYTIEAKTIQTSGSIGIAIFPEDGDNEKNLLENAHIAMHAAKKCGGNTYQFYSLNLRSKILETPSLEKQLRKALEMDEFYLEYQPQISLETGKIIGLEALARWNNPIEGVIPPDKFIPIAEQSGLIRELTKKVIDLICIQFSTWKKESVPIYRTALNLSAYNFDDKELPEYLLSKLEEYHIDPSLLEIEVTESAFFQHLEENLSVLKQIMKMGLNIAIDDFGTGYSSLSYLHFLKVDNVKIDRSFIKELPNDVNSSILVTSIIAMAHSLKISVIAEGVETIEQLEFLRQKGCDTIQGFYISKALRGTKLIEFLTKFKGLYSNTKSAINS